ncbi:MAG: Fic/DOC family protein, partial [Candidatus Dormibacteria bacterium]
PLGRFGPAHYRRIHWHLFRDVYAWAGRYRNVRTGKGGNSFCYPEYIATSMDVLFRRLQDPTFQRGAAEVDFLNALAAFLADLNAIHPFREGNGRTQLAFVDLLAFRAGRPLNLGLLRPQPFLDAMIASFSGETAALRAELAAMRV